MDKIDDDFLIHPSFSGKNVSRVDIAAYWLIRENIITAIPIGMIYVGQIISIRILDDIGDPMSFSLMLHFKLDHVQMNEYRHTIHTIVNYNEPKFLDLIVNGIDKWCRMFQLYDKVALK